MWFACKDANCSGSHKKGFGVMAFIICRCCLCLCRVVAGLVVAKGKRCDKLYCTRQRSNPPFACHILTLNFLTRCMMEELLLFFAACIYTTDICRVYNDFFASHTQPVSYHLLLEDGPGTSLMRVILQLFMKAPQSTLFTSKLKLALSFCHTYFKSE